MENADDLPGFICLAAIWISLGVKGIYSTWFNFAAILILIPNAALPSNNFAKWDLDFSKGTLALGNGAFKNFQKVLGSVNLVSSRFHTQAAQTC